MGFQEFLNYLCCCLTLKVGGVIIGCIWFIGSLAGIFYALAIATMSSVLLRFDWNKMSDPKSERQNDSIDELSVIKSKNLKVNLTNFVFISSL